MTTRTQRESRSGLLGWFSESAWWGPAVLAGLFFAVLGSLLWLVADRSLAEQRSGLASNAITAQESVQRRLDANRDYLLLLAADLARDALDETLFQKRASQYVSDHPELLNVIFVDAQRKAKWSAPPDTESQMLDASVTLPQARQAAETAKRAGAATYTPPFLLPNGEIGFEVVVPVQRGEQMLGVLTGVYSAAGVLRHALQRQILQTHQVSLVGPDGGVLVALPAVNAIDERLEANVPLAPPGAGTVLRLRRYGRGVWGWSIGLLTALCSALVLGMAWGMWALNRQINQRKRAAEALREAHDTLERRVIERTADLRSANEKLEREMAERQRAEERSRQHQHQLAHVMRLSTMGEMAAGLAHELNQPLGAIGGYAQGCKRLLDKGEINSQAFREAVEQMSQQSQRAGRIIQRLREFVSQGAIQRTPANVGELIEAVAELMTPETHQHQIDLHIDAPPDLPPVYVDRIQIEQVLLNLMRNAVEAMREQNGHVRSLDVTAASNGGNFVEVSVRDSGPGCPQQMIEQIFQPFVSVKDGGMGLGLSISRTIIEAHGGRLWAMLNPDRGMTFRLTLATHHGATCE